MKVYSDQNVQIVALIANKAPVTIPAEYMNFKDKFSKEFAVVLPKYIIINTHAINLEESKQPLYGLIYSLGPIELETIKSYLETNLANSFIWLLKFPAGTLILFDKKPNNSLRLCIDYQGFNNIIIKNLYLIPLLSKSVNCLGRAKQFI